MAYDEYEERAQGLDRGAELYDEDLYDDTDNFGERVDNSSFTDDDLMDDDMATDDIDATSAPSDIDAPTTTGARLENDFGEAITANPHLEDQLEDERLSHEAESDYKKDADQ